MSLHIPRMHSPCSFINTLNLIFFFFFFNLTSHKYTDILLIINRAKSLCNAFLSCRANTYANVDSWCEFTIWCSILPASSTRIQGNESSHLYVLGTALSWKWHHSPWPGARCPPRPPEPGGSLSPPLEWQRDWPGIPPARPSSGCPSALGSFPFSDPPGAPSELPSQAYQRAGKKRERECIVKQVA